MRFQTYLIEDEEYEVKSITGKSMYKTKVPPLERSFKNLPRDSKKKAKVKFQDWLGIPKNGEKGYDGKYYSWSHRAIGGFIKHQEVTPDDIAYKSSTGKPYKIKDDKDAKEHALRFMKNVS